MGLWGFIVGAKEEVVEFVDEVQYSKTGYRIGQELHNQGVAYDDVSPGLVDRIASDHGRAAEYDDQEEALYDGVALAYEDAARPWWEVW